MSGKISAIILAAGGSQRFGQPKQLLPWGNQTTLQAVILAAKIAGFQEPIVVLGAEAAAVRKSLEGLSVRIVENPEWQSGQAGSLKLGLAAVPPDNAGALFLLTDQPQISPLLIHTVAAYGLRTGRVIQPIIADRRAHPVYFPRAAFVDLMTISGDQGGRAIMHLHPAQQLQWLDERMALDIDTPADYARLCHLYGKIA